MQEVELILYHLNFYCPVTGQQIVDSEFHEPSPATVFTYLDELGEFQDIDPEFRDVFDSIEKKDGDCADNIFAKLKERITNEAIVCFTITFRGMACGPVATTVRIGIDMNHADQ